MKAVILAAGRGTRMKGLTEEIPKPMLVAHGRPILEHIVGGLVSSGVRRICVITGWHAEVIENHFGDGARWGAEMCYARQLVQDGTGKAPELAREFVGLDDFLLTYGDILVRPNTYAKMLERWRQDRFAALVTATEGQDVTKGGILCFDSEFRLKRIVEKPSQSQLDELRVLGFLDDRQPVWYNAGIYLFQPVVFDFTARLEKSPRGEYELTDAIRAMVDARLPLGGLQIEGRWVDVRDPEVLASLQAG
jgi:dTDP-glucose pyrophosphorylase